MYYDVFICKPLPRKSVYNVESTKIVAKNKVGQVLHTHNPNRTKASDDKGESLTEPIRIMRDISTNTYNIGLSKLVDNVFTEETNVLISKYRLDPKLWKPILEDIKSYDKIPLQTWAEIRFGLKPDELTELNPGRPTKENPNNRTRIMKKKVILYDNPNPFCEDNLEGWLSIQILKHSRRVAQSMESANPSSQGWLLVKQATEHKQAIDDILTQNKSIAILSHYNDKYPVTSELEENILYFLGSITLNKAFKPIVVGKLNPVSIQEKFDDFLKPKQKEDTLRNCKSFMASVQLLEENSERFYAKYLTQQLVNCNGLQESNGKWYWAQQKNRQENIGVFSFNTIDNFINFVFTEMTTIDSKFFVELIQELKNKGMIVPNQFTQMLEMPKVTDIKVSKGK